MPLAFGQASQQPGVCADLGVAPAPSNHRGQMSAVVLVCGSGAVSSIGVNTLLSEPLPALVSFVSLFTALF